MVLGVCFLWVFFGFGNYRIPFSFSWNEMEKSATIDYINLKEDSEFWMNKIIFIAF